MFVTQPKPERQLQKVSASSELHAYASPALLPQAAPIRLAKALFFFMHLLQCLPGSSYLAILCTELAFLLILFNARDIPDAGSMAAVLHEGCW